MDGKIYYLVSLIFRGFKQLEINAGFIDIAIDTAADQFVLTKGIIQAVSQCPADHGYDKVKIVFGFEFILDANPDPFD